VDKFKSCHPKDCFKLLAAAVMIPLTSFNSCKDSNMPDVVADNIFIQSVYNLLKSRDRHSNNAHA
jgi:hypothetical protein